MHVVEQIGQERITRRLLNLIRNQRVGNAYILSGPAGSGKMSVALNFAAALNCNHPAPDLSPCNACESCLKIRKISHPNLHFVFPSPAGKNGKDDDPFEGLTEKEFEPVKEALERLEKDPYEGIEVETATTILISMIRKLRKELMFSAVEPGWQVAIIWRAELLNPNSSNALLKILEEPPGKTVFLILTDKVQSLLPTIRSRCQIIPVNPPAVEEIEEWLVSVHALPRESAAYYAHFSNGDIRLVREFLSAGMKAHSNEIKFFWRALMRGDMTEQAKWMDETNKRFKKDKEAVRRTLRQVLFWLRDAQIIREGGNSQHLIHSAFSSELEGFVSYFPAVDYLKMIRETERVIELTGKNVYFPALIGHLCLSLTEELAHARSGT